MKHRTLAIAVGLSALVASAAPPSFSRAGTHRRRHQREDPQGSAGQLEDPPDPALPDGCLRAAADRLAQPEGRRRVGDQGDGVLGLHERPPRAVGLRAAGLDERASPSARSCRRSRTSSSSKCWRGRRARTARSRRRPSTSSRPTQPTKEELENLPGERQGQRPERHRARRPIPARAGQPRAASQAHVGRSRRGAATTARPEARWPRGSRRTRPR